MQIDFYKRADDTTPQTTVELIDALKGIQGGAWSAQVDIVRKLYPGDAYNQAKKTLPGFTFCGTFRPSRKIGHLAQHSGILLGDLDKRLHVLADRTAIEADPFTLFCYLSPSGAGLKFGLRIPVVTDDDEYKRYWKAGARYHQARYGLDWDTSGKDICRLAYISWDSNLYHNPDALELPEPALLRRLTPHMQSVHEASSGTRHTVRHKAAFTVGGLVAAGQLPKQPCLAVLQDIAALSSAHPEKARQDMATSFADGAKKPLNGGAPWNRQSLPSEEDEALDAPDENAIVIHANISRVVTEGIDALRTLPEDKRLYQRAGFISIIMQGATPPRGIRRPANAYTIAQAGCPRIRELATEAATWCKYDARKKRYVAAPPPLWFAETVMGRPSWPFAPLEAIISAPTIRPDGTILDQYGYDTDTGLYFVPNGTIYPPMPKAPTLDDAYTALTTLNELTCDFPFAHAGHRSAAWAALLSMVARHAIEGNVPLFAIRSTAPGTGKGLLADALSIVALGRISAKWTQGDEEEDRKRLLAIALEGDAVVCIDNVVRPLGSPALDVALTAGVIQDRVLGRTETRAVPLTAVFLATGNNLRFKGDMVRRVVPIDLDSKWERPEERTGFAHTPLKTWVQKERGRLVIAALTILAAYTQAGRPAQGIPQYGSFEEWSETVRSALIWAGEEDPCKGRAALAEESDSTYAALATLLEAWQACFPLVKNGQSVPRTLKQVMMEIDAKRPIPSAAPLAPYGKLLDALGDFDTRYDGDRLNLKTVGMALLKVEGRVVDNRRIRRGQRNTQGVPWHCEEV